MKWCGLILASAAIATAAMAKPYKIERNSALLEFSYEWPSEAAAIPALDKRFKTALAKDYRETVATAKDDQALAKEQKRDFNPHFLSVKWTTDGETLRLLSLERQWGAFTGGAHPNTSYSTLLWDRRLAREIAFGEQFLRSSSFAVLTRSAYCKKLDKERQKRREGEKLDLPDFNACPKYSDLAIGPLDSNRNGRFDMIRFIASPYTAGPYVEGEYVIDVPVSRQLMAALKPVYRSSYEPQRQ